MKKSFSLFYLAFSFFIFSGNNITKAQITILSENFESGVFPSGWNQSTSATDGGWKIGTSTELSCQPWTIPSHTKIMASLDVCCNCNKISDVLKTPSLDLSSYANVAMSFDYDFMGGYSDSTIESVSILASPDGGTTWDTVTYASSNNLNNTWKTVFVDLSAYAGNNNVVIGIRYSDGGSVWMYGCAIDNVEIFSSAPSDIRLNTISPASSDPTSFGIVNSNITIGGTMVNYGIETISSFNFKYSDGINTYSDVIVPGWDLVSYESYDFTHSIPYTIPSAGKHPLTVWVETTGDTIHGNDTLKTIITAAPFAPQHKVVFEEATGSWCGWCVRGTVYMDSIAKTYPESSIVIAVHDDSGFPMNDPMAVPMYDSGIKTVLAGNGFPSIVINRAVVDDPLYSFSRYSSVINDFGYADLSLTANVNYIGLEWVATVNVNAHFATDLNGNYKLAVVFTEDKVTGTTSDYDQHNYYSYQSQNLPLSGGGINFQLAPAVIPASQMVYHHVARAIIDSFGGTSGSLPSNIIADSTYSHTFTYNIPNGYNISNMNVIGLLINDSDGHILNGNVASTITIGMEEASPVITDAFVYPNPLNGKLMQLSVDLAKPENVILSVTNVLGQTLLYQNMGIIVSGNHLLQMDASTLNSGVYLLHIKTSSGIVSRKFVKQ